MHINEVFKAISFRILNSSEFLYKCFGENHPRSFEFTDCNNRPCGNFTADCFGRVYEVVVDPNNGSCYRWVDPNFKDGLFEETKNHGADPTNAWDDVYFTELEVEEDILTKLEAICNGLTFDDRIMVPVDLDDATFASIARMAHERDITLNQMMEIIIQEEINRVSSSQYDNCCGGCSGSSCSQESLSSCGNCTDDSCSNLSSNTSEEELALDSVAFQGRKFSSF